MSGRLGSLLIEVSIRIGGEDPRGVDELSHGEYDLYLCLWQTIDDTVVCFFRHVVASDSGLSAKGGDRDQDKSEECYPAI